MKNNSADSNNLFLNFVNEQALTEKAQRVMNLQNFVLDVEELAKPVLIKLNSRLITDPGTVISPSNYPNLKAILSQSIDLWNKIEFPTKDFMLVRTSGFATSFYFPSFEIPIEWNLDNMVEQIEKFIAENKPEQIIIHPRISNHKASTIQFSLRAQSIPGSIHIQIGKGGTIHINKIEEATQHFDFELHKLPNSLPAEFASIIKPLNVIIPIADNIICNYSDKASFDNVPVYEFKVVVIDDQIIFNLFDYEIT